MGEINRNVRCIGRRSERREMLGEKLEIAVVLVLR